jgi:heat shock protein HslJ
MFGLSLALLLAVMAVGVASAATSIEPADMPGVMPVSGDTLEAMSGTVVINESMLKPAEMSIPMDVELKVISIGGVKVIDGSNVNIMFSSDGTVSGNASVNRFNSSWMNADGKLTIKESAVTMMAGTPELMDQEKMFLDTLKKVMKYEVTDNMITLTAEDGKMIELSKPLPM